MEVQVSNREIYDKFLSSLSEELSHFDFSRDDNIYLAESIINLVIARARIKYNVEFYVKYCINDCRVNFSVPSIKDYRTGKIMNLESWLDTDEVKISRKLETIQKKEVLNTVLATDEEGPGGANHRYEIYSNGEYKDIRLLAKIYFQKGARKEDDSIHGVIDSDLLEIVRDRLKSFQKGPYSSEYNAEALDYIEKALEALNRRVEDRIKRDVLGTYRE